MKTGVIIPVYNLWKEMTLPCLLSIKKYTDLSDVYIYVIDNASQDVCSSEIMQTGKEIFSEHFQYIRNNENMGFAIACNQGAERAKEQGCDALLFLNNDTVVTKNWLPPLLKELENPEIGLVGPLLLYRDNTIQHCGVVYDLNGHLTHIYKNFPARHAVIGRQSLFRAITAAALLARTNEFFSFGKFFEEYKNGFEDIDLCFQYAKKGYACKVVHESIVYHYESKSPNRLNLEQLRHNRNIFVERNKMIKPDAHIYYDNDGYLPALTSDYFFYVRLREEESARQLKEIQSAYSDERCVAMLMDEPYWHEGYFILFDSLYKQKKYQEALDCCTLALRFNYNLEEIFDRYLECRKKIASESVYTKLAAAHEEKKMRRREEYKGNQARLKFLVDEEWRRKLYLTRKLPIVSEK